jgi:hypothetical protein
MKRIIALMFALVSMATAQYHTNYTYSLTDITTSATAGTSAWVNISGQCQLNSLAHGYDLSVWCVGTDHYPYDFNKKTKVWTKHTEMGTSAISLVVQNANNVFSTQRTAYCDSFPGAQFYALFHWNGSAWAPTQACGTNYTIGVDGFLSTTGYHNNITSLFYSNDNGATWPVWSDGWKFVSMWNSKLGCAITTSGAIREISMTENAINVQNMPGTAKGCLIVPNSPAFLAWNTAGGVYLLDYNTVTWKSVAGLTANQLVGITKHNILALDSTGHPYHWNVYAPTVRGTISGIYSTVPMGPLYPPPQHTGKIQVTFPHSIGGAMASQTVDYNKQMAVSSSVSSALCDPIYSDPTSSECTASTSGSEMCSSIGNLGNPGDTQPDVISGTSIDVQSWLYNTQMLGPTMGGTPDVGIWYGEVWSRTAEACQLGIATCSSPSQLVTFEDTCEYVDPIGNQLCEATISGLMQTLPQDGSPYIVITPYFIDRKTGITLCVSPSPALPTYGDWTNLPPCQ